jgi:EmrB/QacA subfamily drug resistance transporter
MVDHMTQGEGGGGAGDRRWVVLAVVSLAQFLTVLDLWVANIALPTLEHAFRPSSLPAVSWILAVYAVFLAALLLPAGRIADSLGWRRSFLIGLMVFGAASLGCALAPSLAVLIACRGIQAAGAAVLMPTSLGLAVAAFPERQRSTAVGVWAAVGGVAAGSGPVLGGVLIEWSWRLIFLINVPLVILGIIAGLAVLPRSAERQAARRPDVPGSLLVLSTVGLICLALTEAQTWPAAGVLALLAAGLALGAVLVIHVRHRPDPIISPRLFTARRFSAGVAGLVAYYTGFAAILLGCTLMLTQAWHYSVLEAAAAIAPGPLTAAIGSPLSGLVSARIGIRSTIVTGAAFFAAAAAWLLAASGRPAGYPAIMLPSMVLWGLANALIQPSLFAAATAAPRSELASGAAVLTMSRQVGSALGVAVLVAVLGSGTARTLPSFDHAWILVLASAVATGLAGLASGGRMPATTQTGTAWPTARQADVTASSANSGAPATGHPGGHTETAWHNEQRH